MNALSKLIAIAAFATAATSPVMAQVVSPKETGSCPSAKVLDDQVRKLNLASVDMINVRWQLKKVNLQPEDIGLTEKDLKAVESSIALQSAATSYCQALLVIPTAAK